MPQYYIATKKPLKPPAYCILALDIPSVFGSVMTECALLLGNAVMLFGVEWLNLAMHVLFHYLCISKILASSHNATSNIPDSRHASRMQKALS